MYHYIREQYNGSGIFGMTTAEFEAQVIWFKTHCHMISPRDFLDRLEERSPLPARSCVLTFDDGLVDHYRYAFPILRKHGLSAFFFLITGPLESGRMATVHKTHLLRQAMGERPFAAECRRRLAARGWVAEEMDTTGQGEAYRWDTGEVGDLKFFLTRVVPHDLIDATVAELFSETMGPEEKYVSSVYVSWEQARELQEAGMVIGGHSHAHRMYSRLEPGEQAADIAACLSALERRLGRAPSSYAYPFGQAATFTDETKSLLRARGVTCAFANVVGTIESGSDPLALGRYDPKHPVLGPTVA
jgi:peptidoglycan/xylan/chitin deacetylase (PgdA/CDA1 family)